MRKAVTIAVAGAGAALAASAWAQQQAGEGHAVYWMSADTTSGMGAMMGGAGGRPSMGSVMGAMMGRGGNQAGYAHLLTLQLGSDRRAAGQPSAEHLPPQGLQAGPSLPLVTPQAAPAERRAPTFTSDNWNAPQTRILLYWGCGEHARPGQPVVIDTAAMRAGKVPPAFAAMAARAMNPPSPARFATYGEWPNERGRTPVPAAGSLVGDHVVRGNYSPEIRFSLGAAQDFLAPVRLTSNSAAASGAVPLVWQPVSGAKGWFLTSMGASGNDMVMWTSSETQTAPLMDYLADGEIARLVQQRVLLPGAADRCTVPAEVARAAQSGMLTVTAFGGEANFSNPVRPARAPAGWRPDWTVKLRTKSSYMGLLGMSMEEMMGGRGEDGQAAGQPGQPPKKKKKSLLDRGLGGFIPH
ncbi:MAG: hypothetical protein JOZ90_00980 [Alphaproteobacteria bacterium]|nr:hypothetical protein [Alphaproteobacteria bacterium]MBV9372359.1 hypothetical protein [Alphaproteobacteria bacterium]MBV9899651.1 hypothetical protein [Alphaproteobacteria bacterium]